MKKTLSNPGFEFIFAFGLIIILGLPPVLMAQTQKDLEIKIVNGDTTINGKNIKDLNAAERKDALSNIKHINGMGGSTTNVQTFTFRNNNSDTMATGMKHMTFRRRQGGVKPMATETIIVDDSAGNVTEMRSGNRREINIERNSNRTGPGNSGFNRPPARPMMGIGRNERKNMQNFDYVTTDKDGIATHVTYHVSEATNDDLKRMPHIEGGKFEIEDLNIVPQFTSGKTLLMFTLPSKVVAEVKLHDSEGRLLWSEKTVNGSFSKTFAMGLNGIYYLQIKQGNSMAVKKIMKEE